MKRLASVSLLLVLFASTLTLWRSQWSIAGQDRKNIAAGSSRGHWTGTDDLGRDRAVRLACALLLGFAGSAVASGLATGISVTLGVAAAFAHRGIGSCLLYLSDLFLTLPWLFLLMMVRSALPLTMPPLRSAAVTFLLLGLLAWPAYARVTYVAARAVRHSEWLIYGRAAGLRASQLAFRHILPRLKPMIASQFIILIPICLVAEANLGALGLGVSEPMASWGSMLLALQRPAAMAGSRWVFLPIALLVTILLLVELLVEDSHAYS